MTNPTYTDRTAILDLPRVKGIVLDRIRTRRAYFAVLDTDMGFVTIEITDLGYRFDLRLKYGKWAVYSLQRRDLTMAVRDCLVMARKKNLGPIVWLLTEPESEPQPQEVIP